MSALRLDSSEMATPDSAVPAEAVGADAGGGGGLKGAATKVQRAAMPVKGPHKQNPRISMPRQTAAPGGDMGSMGDMSGAFETASGLPQLASLSYGPRVVSKRVPIDPNDKSAFTINIPQGAKSIIKQAVDELRTPGRFLLTGSANALLLPRLSDSLAGRMESIRLMTLSECEIQGRQAGFLTKLLDQNVPTTQDIRVREHLLHRLVTGCFPEPLQRTSERRCQAWYQQYLSTLIQRDIRDLTHIDHPDLMAKLEAMARYMPHNERVNTEFFVSGDIAEVVSTDASWCFMILLNLLSNAFKATQLGSITVSARLTAGHIRFTVADTGVGLSSTVEQNLWKAFKQSSRWASGTGLGLYHVHHLANALEPAQTALRSATSGSSP